MSRTAPPHTHVSRQYDGHVVTYRDDGWFNATEAAAKFGKLPNEWLRQDSTSKYLQALERKYGRSPQYSTRAGWQGGTWMHPRLAIAFARWLDEDFAVWCDAQIEGLLRGGQDWQRVRHEAASSYKVMSTMLRDMREEAGKDCATHHYQNEAKLVNWALQGEFRGIDREALNVHDLDLLAMLEVRNTMLLARGLPYAERKPMLEKFARDWRVANQPKLEQAA
jgi:hypothetical protein